MPEIIEPQNSIALVDDENLSQLPVQRIAPDLSMISVRSIIPLVIVIVFITLLVITVVSFAFNIVSSLTHLLFMIVLSIFFAYLIEPLIYIISRPFEKTRRDKYMPRPLAIAAAYLIVFSVVGIAIAVLAPLVSEQARNFSTNSSGYANSIQTGFSQLSSRFEGYQIPDSVQNSVKEKVSGFVGEASGQITTILLAVVSYLPWLILIPILAFFFLKDVNLFRAQLLQVFPSGDWRTRIESLIHDVNKTLAAYIRAQLISCVLIGTICTVGFYLFGLKYALLLGIIAGALEFIPLLGPLTIGTTAVIIASIELHSKAIYVAIFLVVLRICQDYIFYPRIVREGIHLPPLAIILSVLAGEEIAGIPGVFISIPVVAIMTVVYRHLLEYGGSKGIIANTLVPKEKEIDRSVDAQVAAVNTGSD